MKLILKEKFKSLEPFTIDSLPDFVVLTGINGSGKTQLLTAIEGRHLKALNDNDSELDRKKYITSQTLSPDNVVSTSIQITSSDQRYLLERINDYKEYKKINPNISLQQFFSEYPPHYELIQKISQITNKNIEELTPDDISTYCPFNNFFQNIDVFYQTFSEFFKLYQDKYDNNRYREFRNNTKNENVTYLTVQEFKNHFGEAPWHLVNRILEEANLNYRVNSPENNNRDTPFYLKLIDKDSKVEINFGDLSSGEKVIMSLALVIYNSKFDTIFPEILLMDEPDASLHPSMSKKLLDVIQQVFVNEKKVKVIMTTHSPSTVALAPEESIYVVNRGGKIEKTSKDGALKILTSGVPSFSVNYENRRQVFVESRYDVGYYEKIYSKLSKHLIPEISLTFISSGESRTDKNGTKISSCDQVINITQTLRDSGNKFISGIIDWDLSNENEEGISVLGEGKRYSIENYILDPLLVGAMLLREKFVDKKDMGLTEEENFMSLKSFSKERLQKVADYVVEKVSEIVKPTDNNLISCKLLNELEINIPKWYLHHQGHELEEQILKTFPNLNSIKANKEEKLKEEILNKIADDVPEILSYDFLETLKNVQEMS
ncbi:hypothetical protein CAPN004_06430 [Capnocytophaga cynodegmi]|uniref:AAA family ATPase n=1 Tax=Capnocytophaga cynodegmi TaxID=28189 RepID=UPI001AC4B358|nr:ATP-binding protein [Capnocytophaga cynodegmi]GIM51613.1 hypothetical protein CAPN004_06430 [Capnocytophaga cynodegmi]